MIISRIQQKICEFRETAQCHGKPWQNLVMVFQEDSWLDNPSFTIYKVWVKEVLNYATYFLRCLNFRSGIIISSRDSLIAFATLPMDKAHEYRGGNIIRKYPLYLKGKEGLINRPGGLWLKVLHTTDMHLLWKNSWKNVQKIHAKIFSEKWDALKKTHQYGLTKMQTSQVLRL